MQAPISQFVNVESTKLHYLSTSHNVTPKITLLLHGWPTSSYLWRNVMTHLALDETVIALDLPGFGQSDKPTKGAYSLDYYEQIIQQFLDELGVKEVDLVVHDLGGPVGLYWAVRNQNKLHKLVLLNTLIYPELHWFVKLFIALSFVPGIRGLMSSQRGIKFAMQLGTTSKLPSEYIDVYQSPFQTKQERLALIQTLQKVAPSKLAEVAAGLKELTQPVQIIYGTKDFALPDVANTMKRVKQDLPQADVHKLQGCGHFLQEDEPKKVSSLIREFLVA
ncbi:MAG: alpha/beta hydrolase [Pseudomonadales bacterium]|nr:alpha/beta hydrolase [Pseudomonadales bacterium]